MKKKCVGGEGREISYDRLDCVDLVHPCTYTDGGGTDRSIIHSFPSQAFDHLCSSPRPKEPPPPTKRAPTPNLQGRTALWACQTRLHCTTKQQVCNGPAT